MQSYLIDGALEVSDGNKGTNVTGQNTAVPFMKQIIEQNPGEITLVAIGQLTNIALLLK